MHSDYFGRRLREQNIIGIGSDDDAIASLLAQLMDVPSVDPQSATPVVTTHCLEAPPRR